MADQFDRMLNRDESLAHTDECADCTSALSRRALLGGLFAGGVAMLSSGGLAVQASFADTGYTGDTIVVLSLRGGMDGLSAIAPLGDASYAAARPTTALGASDTIALDSMFGMHSALQPMKSLWDAGQFAAVHAVGSMDQTRSHFSAMEQIENAAPGSSVRTGWLDRVMTLRDASGTFTSSTLGQSTEPLMTAGPYPQMVMQSIATTKLHAAKDTIELRNWMKLTEAMHSNTGSPFGDAVHNALEATMTTMGMAANKTTVTYPTTPLGSALSDIAAMIKANVGLQVATVDQGDWDHHSNARERMTTSLSNLSACIAAFVQDLGELWSKVSLVTLSEFGRRVAENGSAGFDHGHGNVMFLASGSGLSSAKVFGQWPGLALDQLRGGEDLAGTTDYRSVLTELFSKRGGMTSSQAATAFPGFTPIAVGAFI